MKQFTTIPEKSIADFFIIAKEEYNDNELIINFDIVCDWLNVRKDSIKRVLIDNFEENFDYTINSINKKHENTKRVSKYNEIFITPNCFKKLCYFLVIVLNI